MEMASKQSSNPWDCAGVCAGYVTALCNPVKLPKTICNRLWKRVCNRLWKRVCNRLSSYLLCYVTAYGNGYVTAYGKGVSAPKIPRTAAPILKKC
jgi:hypothetical protein